jgi:CRISPR-associated protein Cst2
MAYPIVTAAVLIEANGAALNNAGQETGARVDNAIVVKQIRIGRLRYPYISGQAWRRWWREVLYADFGWPASPVTVIARPQQAFTAGDPIRFQEDDLFGYMVARRRDGGGQGGTFRRISPLKNSLLISVLPNVIGSDFGHFTRNLPAGANPLLYEAEHYTSCLQGAFTISLADVGEFAVGEMADLSADVRQAHQNDLEEAGERAVRLGRPRRVERVQQVLQSLARLRGGAHLARNLSDVVPVGVLVGFMDGGNAPLQRLFEPDESNERVRLNLTRLRSVLNDYRDRMLTPPNSRPLFFGYRPTVLANEAEVLNAFANDAPFSACIAVAGTAQQALDLAASAVAAVFERHVG